MNLPAAILVVRCLVRDTFRESLASRTFWLILGSSGLCILFCLSLRISGVTAYAPPGELELYGADDQPFTGLNPGRGQLEIAFGAIRLPIPRDAGTTVSYLHNVLVLLAGGAVGMLLVLLWTSGFLPEFLQPRCAAVVLAKPVPRWALLLGKYLGVLAFVAVQVGVFVVGTWAALGVKTGYWSPAYLLAIPLLLLEFAILYSFSALVAVWTRSTVVCVALTLAFWSLCATASWKHYEAPAPGTVTNAAYWVLPKPTDALLLLGEVLGSEGHFSMHGSEGPRKPPRVAEPELSVFSSLLFSAALLSLAAARFRTQEY